MIPHLVALLPALLALHPLPAHPPHHHAPQPGATIEGRVTGGAQHPRRVAGAYAGMGSAPRTIAPVPRVAFLEGPVAGARAAAPGQAPRLVQQDTAFRPAVLVVPAGSTVEFPNRDPFFHNVFSYSAPRRFDLGRYPRGESRSVRFERAATVRVLCEIHRWMRAGIVVVDNPFHAQVRADGGFTLAGVPPGRYRLSVWDFDRGKKTVEVAVPASGGTVRVDVAF